MPVISTHPIRDEHGAERTVAVIRCDGPGCEVTTDTSAPDALATWATLMGFMDPSTPPDEVGPLEGTYYLHALGCLVGFVDEVRLGHGVDVAREVDELRRIVRFADGVTTTYTAPLSGFTALQDVLDVIERAGVVLDPDVEDPDVWCSICGHHFTRGGQPTCEHAGDYPVDPEAEPEWAANHARRVAAIRVTRSEFVDAGVAGALGEDGES